MLASDIGSFLFWNTAAACPSVVAAACNGICLAAVALGCYYWFQFIELRLSPGAVRTKIAERTIRAPLLLLCALDLLSVFTGWVFYVSADNQYMLGKLFWVQSAVTLAYLLVPTVHAAHKAVKTTDARQRRENLTYVAFLLVCIAAVYAGDYVPTLPLFALSIFAVILILFLTLYLDREYALAKRERELTEASTAVMLSQIQPHFLYNTLCAIQALCTEDPPEAARTTALFASFLRGDLDSLSRKEPVSFELELRHTRNYLELEQKRFSERLHIVYDIRATAFFLPTLTLQPIVENAVNHGLSEREEGGTVRISSEETDRAYVITVTDNGVGFDASAVGEDGRAHIGIANVRGRLRVLCGGTLTVESSPGEGTTAVIAIPKEGTPK